MEIGEIVVNIHYMDASLSSRPYFWEDPPGFFLGVKLAIFDYILSKMLNWQRNHSEVKRNMENRSQQL